MNNYYYKKTNKIQTRKVLRFISIGIFILGILLSIYVFSPLFFWQVYFAPAFASQTITLPIPKSTVVTSYTISGLLTTTINNLRRVDYTDARNWFPDFRNQETSPKISSYTISIPKLSINDAIVSTTDYDLSIHLVNYAGTSIPPQSGTAVVFGHSTLPQLFNQKDYKTIFATLYKLEVKDEIIANISGVSYTYIVYNISVVNPDDTSLFTQTYDNSYITLVTCTPPGTTWKRLLIKARLKSI